MSYIYTYIYVNRSYVELLQMDINKEASEANETPQLTPGNPLDDASQEVAIRHKGKKWM